MIFIDPSELRETSNLLRYISNMVYNPLPGLEALTGADVMISPSKLPLAQSDKLILSHIKSGAKLIQIKFGHDLPTSIIDGRLNEALSRMLKCGANPWQCCLLFIGLLGYDETRGMATINGQLTYGNYPMKWRNVNIARLRWIHRGGHLFDLSSGKRLPEFFEDVQKSLDLYANKPVKEYMPKAPKFEEVIEPDNPELRKWGIGQKLVIVEDLRSLICSIPGARIGADRANKIWHWMAENEIRQDLTGFLSIVENEQILEVSGIGKGLLKAINRGLFMTLEERDRNESN